MVGAAVSGPVIALEWPATSANTTEAHQLRFGRHPERYTTFPYLSGKKDTPRYRLAKWPKTTVQNSGTGVKQALFHPLQN